MKKFIVCLLIFAYALSLVSCFETDLPLEEVSDDPIMILPDEDYTSAGVTQESDVLTKKAKAPEEAVVMLGTDLMKALYKDEENLLISPVSVSLALGLTAGGADGETLTQLEALLGCGISFDEMSRFYQSLTERLDLSLANSLWLKSDSGTELKKSYLQFADEYFNAEAFNEKFDSSTLKKINGWVKDKTDGMIPKLLDEISPDTVMYIINALSFEAEWQKEYKMGGIDNDFVFTDASGRKQTVTAMSSSENVYLEEENATGFVKNYKDGKYGFAVLLPNEGVNITDYVKGLTGEGLLQTLNAKTETKVIAKFPKFKTEYKVSLNEALASLGVCDAFTPSLADFSRLTEADVYVSQVLHKTYIEVAEKGTRAAAVTSVEMPKGAMPEKLDEPKCVTVDRPFVYAIIDNTSNLPLFIGVVQNIV